MWIKRRWRRGRGRRRIPCGGSIAILTDCSSVAGEKGRCKWEGMMSEGP